ncbi:Cdc2-related protein kinase, partial [Yamadazyma tenuis ATCC 10573]
MNRLKNFEILKKLGKGTFGVVQKAKYIKTGEIVALKQLLNHSAKEGFPITAMREITIMKKLNHTNVLKIQDMIYEEPKTSTSQDVVRERGCFYTVCGYMSSDLVGILSNPHITLKMSEIKCLMIQLLKGIQYIHEQNFLHRDVKTANILIDEHGTLKIADFGLARVYHGTPPTLGQGPGGGERNYTSLVVTRWYRPPEILLGDRKYTTAVDMWGVGCVFGELFTRKPILSGKTDSHQCQIIFQLLGSPTTDWSGSLDLPNKTDLNIGLTCKRVFEDEYGPIINDAQGLDLMSHLLTLNPYKRFNALDALDHPFF